MKPRILGWIVLLAALIGGWVLFQTKPYSELPLYIVGAERLVRGETLYRQDERAYTYPALLALPFIPFLYLPESTHRTAWYLMNVVTIAIMARFLYRTWLEVRRHGEPVQTKEVVFFWGTVLALAGRHLLSPFENQSHDLLIVLCVGLTIRYLMQSRHRLDDLLAGFWSGLGAAAKATPLLFAPVFLWQRRWLAAVSMAVTIPFCTLAVDVIWPTQDGQLWCMKWYDTFLKGVRPGESPTAIGAWGPANKLNQSIAGTLHRYLKALPEGGGYLSQDQVDVSLLDLDTRVVKWITLAAQGSLFLSMLYLLLQRHTRNISEANARWVRFGQGSAVVTAMVLLSPTSIKTHFAVLIFPVFFCTACYFYHRRSRGLLWGLTGVLLLGTLTVKGLLGRDLGDVILTCGSVTWCSLLLYLLTAREILRARSTSENCSLPLSARAIWWRT